jgi:hypothetical protein
MVGAYSVGDCPAESLDTVITTSWIPSLRISNGCRCRTASRISDTRAARLVRTVETVRSPGMLSAIEARREPRHEQANAMEAVGDRRPRDRWSRRLVRAAHACSRRPTSARAPTTGCDVSERRRRVVATAAVRHRSSDLQVLAAAATTSQIGSAAESSEADCRLAATSPWDGQCLMGGLSSRFSLRY